MGGRGSDGPWPARTAPYRIPAGQLIEEEFPYASEDAPVVAFAEKVEETLKYRISNTVRFEEGKIPTLLAQFQEHEIQLYRPSEVREYRTRKTKEVRKEINKGRKRINMFISALLLIGAGILLRLWLSGGTTTYEGNWTNKGATLFLISFAVTLASIMWLISLFVGESRKVSWHSYVFESSVGPYSYKGVIPESTLQLMLTIKEKIPSVKFKISVLEVERSSEFDPIVYAYLEEEREFKAPVAIWEEPGFHGRLIDATNGGRL